MDQPPHIWAFGPYYLEAAGWPSYLSPTPPPKIFNPGRASSSRWLDREGFWRNCEVKHHLTPLYADSVQPVGGKRRSEFLTPSMNTNSKVGKHLPTAGVSLEGIQQCNEGKHGGWRSRTCDTIRIPDTDSLTQSRIRARREQAESSSADRLQGAVLRKVPQRGRGFR